MVVAVLARQPVGVRLGEELDALVGLDVVLDPELLAAAVDPHVRVGAVAVHVAVALGDAAVAHQPGDHVRRLGGQRPEVPLHVVVAQPVVRAALLRPDEVLEFHRVLDEEHRRVVAHQVVVALLGVELQREAAGVAPGVRAALLARDGGEAGQHLGPLAGLEEIRLGELADVIGDLEDPVRPAALGVHHPLGDPFAVELGHLLDQVVVLEQDRTGLAGDGQRVLVALHRDADVVRRVRSLGRGVGHSERLHKVRGERGGVVLCPPKQSTPPTACRQQLGLRPIPYAGEF